MRGESEILAIKNPPRVPSRPLRLCSLCSLCCSLPSLSLLSFPSLSPMVAHRIPHRIPPASAGRKPCSRRVPVHPLSTPPRLFPSYRLRLYFPAGLSAPPIVRIRPVFSPGECPAVCKRKKTARELPRAAVLRRFARLSVCHPLLTLTPAGKAHFALPHAWSPRAPRLGMRRRS